MKTVKNSQIKKIALVTHSIPHFEVSLYRAISSNPYLELMVFYSHEIGIKERFDPLYNRTIQWGVPLLDGYSHQLLKNRLEIIRALKKGKFDAVIVYGYNDLLKILTIITCRIIGIPLIFRGTATLLDHRDAGRIKQMLKRVVLKFIFKQFSAFLVGGTYNRDYFRYYGVEDERMFFVPFTVDVERFIKATKHYKPQREKIRQKIGLNFPIAILFVGTLTPIKGPHILLSAFHKLAQVNKDVCLLIAGDGVLMDELQRYAQKHNLSSRVKFLGFVDQNELPKIYLSSDFVVFPSLSDTWARAVNEAMACGLPVIASRKVGATGDIVKDGVNGFIVREGDVEDLAAKMQILVGNPEMREKMGRNSKRIIEQWTYEAAIPNVIKAIEYVCKCKYDKI